MATGGHGGHGAPAVPVSTFQEFELWVQEHLEIVASTTVVLAALVGSALGMGSGRTMEVAALGGVVGWFTLLFLGPCAAEGTKSIQDAAKFFAYGLGALVGGGWFFFGADPASWKITYACLGTIMLFLVGMWGLSGVNGVKGHAEFLGPYVTLSGCLVLAVVLAAQVRGYVWVAELAPPFGQETRPAVAAWFFLGLPWNVIVPVCLLWGIGVGVKMVKVLYHDTHPTEGQVWGWFLPFTVGATLIFSFIP